MLYDLHTHTSISDGVLSPLELVRRALVNGYNAIAITDHVGIGYLKRLITEITADCALAQNHWNITAIPGVELTHLPATAIAEAAKKAKELGAKLVVVHGQTVAEPVEPGTNLAALKSPHVDILAHPGMLFSSGDFEVDAVSSRQFCFF
jgi:histidinol phosphatase-like PHP family hydrolase